MEKINIVLVGCGCRGTSLAKVVINNPNYVLVGVCDTYEDKAQDFAKEMREERGLEFLVYTDYQKMFDEAKPDAVLIAASWEQHVAIALDAMRKKIAVALEVGGAYCEEDCWDLVRVWEETQTPFMIMENCCFNSEELLATNLVRHGILGKVNYCHGAYMHDLREEISYGDINRHYRLRNYMHRNCENYPTHELGPIAKLLNINRGNRMVSLVSCASSALGLHEYVQDKEGLEYLADKEFKQGDIVETLITCENGELISLRLDTTLPNFYSREFTVRGTKGLYMQNGNMVLLDGKYEEIWEPKNTFKKYLDNATEYYDEYLPEMWKNATEDVLKSGHGGMDYFEFVVFADCLKNGKEMPCDVYDAATWMAVTYLSEESIKKGGAPVQVPDFTKGKYKDRKPQDVIDFKQKY